MFDNLKDAKILIVDDQEANVSLLEVLCRRDGFAHVRSTTDSRTVVALFSDFAPDLILLDLLMPHLSGFEVLEQLRPLIPDDAYLPILVLTADVTPEVKRRALASGAKDFLTKPLDVLEVMLRITNLLETRLLHRQLQSQNLNLEEQVRHRTAELVQANTELRAGIAERDRAELEIQHQLQRLRALREIDLSIIGSTDLHLSLNVVLEQVMRQLSVDATDILLFHAQTHTLEYAAGRGFRSRAITHTRLRLGQDSAGRAALEREVQHVADLSASARFGRAELVTAESFVEYYGVPLLAKGQVIGVLEAFHRQPIRPDPNWLEFLEALAGQAAIAIDNAQLFVSLQRSNAELVVAYETTLEGWSNALDLRDRETEGHTLRVTEMTERLARTMGIDSLDLVHIRRGALLHDIGKMGVPDSILLKPGKLLEEEWAVMRMHPVYAYQLLSPITYLRPALDIPYAHHERWDGHGYPRGLRGEEIPLAARLFAVVDVWDALRSDRPYRLGWPDHEVVDHIRSLADTHFDSAVVDIFLGLVENSGSA